MNGLRLSDIYKFTERPVESSWHRPAMMGVHFANGWVEATDAHILIREKYEYDSELEGKIIGRYGEEIDGVFPNCEKAIPNFFSEGYEPLRIDWNMLYDICQVLVILGQQHYCECAIKVGNCYFYPKHLKTIAAMCVRHECSVIYLCNARPCNAAAVPLGYGAMAVVARGESELFFDYGYPLDYGNRRERMSELHDELQGFLFNLNEQLTEYKVVQNYKMQKERKALVVKIGRFETCIRILEKYIGKNVMGGKINE